jgi:arylsulfatase A-like enzyme
VDDRGWQDTQVPFAETATPFNERYRTPTSWNWRRRMKFTDFDAAAPGCSPTRVTLITGRSPARPRVTNWTQHEGQDTSEPYPLVAVAAVERQRPQSVVDGARLHGADPPRHPRRAER